MRLSEFAMIFTATQLNKAIPLLLDIRDSVQAVEQNVKTFSQEVRTVGENVKEVGQDVKAVREELKGIRKDTGSLKEGQIEIIAELRDNNIGCNERFAGMESDIQSIKNKVGAS